ncbi:relaxase/mobilization nuclease domain-containing protein [Laspinema sp. D1]|uniref:relaxase/mobilization nuclease domain-containing protein n=1 Tax=Laspinema palackyanum TaxID=3231601 RepID=UPI00346F36BD|nr:relaxase/mobilization nuclease domain-containing protein [Laspinema sp. D2b]
MIGKVTKGNNFTGLLSYVLDKPGAKYIGASQLSGEQSHQWAAQFMRVAAKRRRTEYPVAHYSFSPPPNQPMADETAYRYAQKFCQRMGHENCQWLLVRHTDTKTENGEDRDHFHLVVNRVSIDGTRTVSSFNDWYRSQAAHRALSEEFELERVPSVWETDRRNPSTGQIRRVRRQNREYAEGKRSTPADPIILTELQDRIDKYCQDRPNLTDLVERLLSSGVNVRIQPASNGALGISYQLGSVAVAGSSLGRAYTVKGLQQRRGVAYYPAYDDPILKLFLKDEWYDWRYLDPNRNRPRIRQKPTSAETTPGDLQEPAQKPKSTQPELSPASTSKAPAKPDFLNEEEYRQWCRQVAPVIDAYLKHQGVTITEGKRFRAYKRGLDLVLEQQRDNRTLMIAHNTEEGSWEKTNYFPVERSIAKHILEQSLPAMQQDMRPYNAWFSLRGSGPPPDKPDLLGEEEYRQWVTQVAPVLNAYIQHQGVPLVEGYYFRTYKRGLDLVLEQQRDNRTLMIAHKTSEGSWETRNYLPVKRPTAQYILLESLPALQQEMRPPDAWFSLGRSGPPPAKPDLLGEEEYRQWCRQVAPVLDAYIQHQGVPLVEGYYFRTYKRGLDLVLEQQRGNKTLMIAHNTSEGSWEARKYFPVERPTAQYILSESLPTLQQEMKPPDAWLNLDDSESQPSPGDLLNRQEYQHWVNTVAPVLFAYFEHHQTPTFEGERFNAYRHGESVSLKPRHKSFILMMARKTSEGSWEARTCDSVDYATAKYIWSEFLPAMRLHNPSLEVKSSSTTPPPKASQPPVATPSETPPTKPSQSPVATPSPTPPTKAAQSPVATPSPTPPPKAAQSPAAKRSPTPTQDPPDILNEQEYQQWVNTVAPSLNTYLKHRGGRMVEGDRFRTYKRGQYLVLEYLDGSDTLILGRPTGKGSWETPDPVPFKVKREDANYILERSIPLMQRQMSQDKERAQNKKRSRSRQLDISD